MIKTRSELINFRAEAKKAFDLQKKKEETLHLVSGLTDQHVRQFVKNMIVNEDSYIIDTILKYVRRV